MSDGKAHRRRDPGQVHVLDPGVDVPAAAAHLVEVGRLHRPLVLRSSDTAFNPMFGKSGPRRSQTWRPSRRSTTCGRPVGQPSRHAALEQVGRLDQVVVDRHDAMPRRCGRRRLRCMHREVPPQPKRFWNSLDSPVADSSANLSSQAWKSSEPDAVGDRPRDRRERRSPRSEAAGGPRRACAPSPAR